MSKRRIDPRYAPLVRAAKRVPIIRRSHDKEPWSTCLGCGAVDSEDCKLPCWVAELELAISIAEGEEPTP